MSVKRNLRALMLGASAITVAAPALADSFGEAVSERPHNLSWIGAADYFESLGWNYEAGDWTGTVTWDPLRTDTAITLTPAERDQALGAGAAVAVLDGRANDTHSDLPFNSDPGADPLTDSVVFEFTGFPFSPSYTEFDLHGTHTSGIVGARLNGEGTSGVAPMARILNYAVFDDKGWVGANEDDVLTHAISYGASVANMSYGPVTAGDFSSSTTLIAINNHKSEIVVVKAAGNDGIDMLNESLKGRDSNLLPNLIIAGSVEMARDADGNVILDASGMPVPEIAWYSNTPGSACISNRRGCVVPLQDIFMVAPGGAAFALDSGGYVDGIWSTDELGGYYRISGTSMAAPHIAGAVALLHSQWPVLKSDPLATRNILFETATDLGDDGDDAVYGQGLLNVNAAMSPVGAPDFSLTSGGGSDGGGGGGGNKGKKPKKTETWALGSTSMVVKHGFAALTETQTTISVFDNYRRDFSVPLSSLVREGRSDLSNRLEAMVGVSMSWADQDSYVPGRDDFHKAITMDDRDLRGEAPLNMMSDIQLASFDEIDARVFIGSGNVLPLIYAPGVIVGGMSSLSGTNSGINPVLGFASGEKFAGAAFDKVGPFRFAAGYAERDVDEPLLGDYKAGATVASVSLALDETQKVNVAVTDLRETGGVFGSRSQGALSFGEESRTRAITMSWDQADWRGFVVSASWTMGVSNGDSNGLLTLDDETLSDAFHFGIARTGLVDDRDRLAVSLSQPLRIVSGSLHLYADGAYDENAVMQMQSETISLNPSGRELDVQVEYRFATARSGAFSAFAYHAMDAGHIAGREESGAGMKYAIRF